MTNTTRTLALALLLAATAAQATVTGRYIYLGNGLSEKMELAEFEVYSGGENIILKRPEVFTHGLEYSWYMLKRTPENLAGDKKKLVDGNRDPAQRVSFGAKVAAGYGDIELYYTSLELDLGKETPLDSVTIHRSRYTNKVHKDLGWRVLLVLDEARRIVSWQTFNVYSDGWREMKDGWDLKLNPATGTPAGRVIPAGARSPISEAEFLRDYLGKPVVDLVAETTAEDKARLARFRKRNEPAAIAELGREFFRLIDLTHPSLADVRALVEKKDFAAALDAFKTPFFKELAPIKDWNAGEGTSIYSHYTWETEPDTLATCRARDLRNGVFGDRNDLTVKRFTPGLMPPARLTFPLQTRPLLLNYVVTKDVEDLRLWEAMTDDWSIGFQDAADKNRQKLRGYFVLLHGGIMGILKDFCMASEASPAFAQDLSGATLARFLMPVLEEIPVANWRVTRKCIFNHTYNGVPEALFVSSMLTQFYAGQRWQREARQAFERLYTMNQYRDGSMVEVGDEGHFLSTIITPSNYYSLLEHRGRPAWFTSALETYFLDNYRANVLMGARNISPCGTNVRWNPRSNDLMYLDYELDTSDPYWRNVTDMRLVWGDGYPRLTLPILKEREPRAIIDTVHGRGTDYDGGHWKVKREKLATVYGETYDGPPSILSDWMPYSGLWYFRGGWDHEAAFLHMVAPSSPHMHSNCGYALTSSYSNMHETFGTTSYRFYDYMTPLLTGNAVWIDNLPACPQEGLVPCGSKQGNFTQAVEKPQNSRWYTDAVFDFGEATYRGNYRVAKEDFDHKKREHFVNISEEIVKDVETTRQIFQVRPGRLFLQVDRMRYSDTDEHTNMIKNVLIVTEPSKESGKTISLDQVSVEPSAHRLVLNNPDNIGMTVAWFGQTDLVIEGAGNDRHPDLPRLGGPSPTHYGNRKTAGCGVRTSWKGRGESVLLSVLRSHQPGETPIRDATDISTATVAGTRVTMADGVVVTLLIARQAPSALSVDDVTAVGEGLLLLEQPGKGTSGLGLGIDEFRIGGKRNRSAEGDFRFSVGGDRKLLGMLAMGKDLDLAPMRRPIDPPTIGPAATAFSDSTTVCITSETPGVEIEYIAEPMDDPNQGDKPGGLARDSANATEWKTYTRPFRVSASTFVRARARSKGVEGVPFTAAGTDVSAISYGFFHRKDMLPALGAGVQSSELSPGLRYDYLEGRWFALWTYTDQLPAKKTGTVGKLLDVSMRETDGPFGVRYHGYIDVPQSGVYTFHGPEEFVQNKCEPGYDLRVFVDGEEWRLEQVWHGQGTWSVPLEKGLHRFRVTFADARAKDIDSQEADLAFSYPRAQTTWRGIAPVIEVSGPGLAKQPIPNEWLKR